VICDFQLPIANREFNTSATVEFVFAPAERDVYNYQRTPKDLAPLGAQPGGENFARDGQRNSLLRNF